MKKTNLTRSLALSFLVLMISNHPLPSTAEAQSIPPSLEGTEWKADTIRDPKSDLIFLQFVFVFEKQGKVGYRLLTTEVQAIMRLVYDPVARIIIPRTFAVPGPSNVTNEVGTYRQDGSSIHLEFPHHSIDAIITITGDRMKGTITFKAANQREELTAVRTPKGETTVESRASNMGDREAGEICRAEPRLTAQGKYREAIQNYTAAIVLNPSDAKPYLCRANAKFQLRDYREAIADYDQVIRIYTASKAEEKARVARDGTVDPNTVMLSIYAAEAYYNRGVAKNILGNKADACDDFRESCKLNSDMCEKSKKLCS